MSKYNVGDKFVIEIAEIIAGYKNNPDLIDDNGITTVLHRIRGFNSLVFDEYGLDKLGQLVQGVDQFSYNKGMEEAWELTKKIYNMDSEDRSNAFGISPVWEVLKLFTPQEAKKKLEAWKESKKISVGDVLVDDDGSNFMVISLKKNGYAYGIFDDGEVSGIYIDKFKKTRKHVDLGPVLKFIGDKV